MGNGNKKDQNQNQNHKQDCCLDLSGIGPPPPDWAASSSTFNNTYNGLVYDRFSPRTAHMWSFDKDRKNNDDVMRDESRLRLRLRVRLRLRLRSRSMSRSALEENGVSGYDYHTMQQVADYGNYYGRPLVFTFPGKNAQGRQDFHYQVETMRCGPQNPRLFQLPHRCADKACA